MSEAATEADFLPVTTTAAMRRHWGPNPDYRGMHTLCGLSALDQAALNVRGKVVSIVDLPTCAQCDRSKQRRLDGRSW